MQRSYSTVIDDSLLEDAEDVLAVFKDLIVGHDIAEVLRHLNHYLLDSEQINLFLVRVMSVELALKERFQEEARIEPTLATGLILHVSHNALLEQDNEGALILQKL